MDEDHEQHPPIIQLSLDGIQESKSSSNTLDCYCVKFNHCQNIYPIRIIKPCEKFKYDEKQELKNVLDDLNANGVTIDCAVLDQPKRSFARCAKCFSAKYACEYCESCAVTYIDSSNKKAKEIKKRFQEEERMLSQQLSQLQETQEGSEDEEINELQSRLQDLNKEKDAELQKTGRKQLTWPKSTMNGPPRTLNNIREITDEIERNPEIVKTDPHFCKGIKGRSLFLNQPSFHLIKDAPCEYMHLVCLGVTKRMVELTFKVGENRDRVTKRKLSPPVTFNLKIKDIQLTREFSRRCRNLDFGVMKASEFRNILIFFFPIVIDCIEVKFKKEREIWLHLVFMVRACVIPNEEFRDIDDEKVNYACEQFYTLYEKTYGQINCTYSIHAVSHILKIRQNRPLTYKSAFKFENFFSELRNLFQPGTVSPLKQVFQNCYAKRLLAFHHCEKKTFFSAKKTQKPGKKMNPGKEINHLIYTYDEDRVLTMFIIIEIIDEDTFKCNIQGKYKANLPLSNVYDWSKVGVYRAGAVSEELKIIKRQEISGKVIQVQNYLITCPNNVLHEQ